MRIAVVNATGGGLSGGYLKYLSAILPRIEGDRRVDRLELFLPQSIARSGLVDHDAHSWPINDAANGFPQLRVKLREMRPDVVFVPTARWIEGLDSPVVAMVRNMEPLSIPFSPRDPVEIARNLGRRYAAYRSCTRSAGVIAVSMFVQDFLKEKWHIPSENLALVYHGVSLQEEQDLLFRPDGVQVLAGRQFLFTAGSIRPARGLEDAIGALADIAKENPSVGLAIAGSIDRRMGGYSARLHGLAKRLGCGDRVWWLGPLDVKAMTWAFKNCIAFLMTSRTEACPNTALEAMAQGCICVSTDAPPMPEMFGQAARYYRARDSQSLSKALSLVLRGDPRSIGEMRRNALDRAAQFSWDTTARSTVDFLQTRARQK
jgi:glycosyltransferase involved in cell wall biosynthesis